MKGEQLQFFLNLLAVFRQKLLDNHDPFNFIKTQAQQNNFWLQIISACKGCKNPSLNPDVQRKQGNSLLFHFYL